MGCCNSKSSTEVVRLKTVSSRGLTLTSQTTSSALSQQNFRENYVLGKVIGHGHFGIVREGKHIPTSKKYAIKTIDKRKMTLEMAGFKREVEILQRLDHPNLISTYASYEDAKYVHIVTELCTGGELYDQLITKSRYKEKRAAKIMRQILHAISYLHQNGICHRDLKPENFLFASNSKDADLKLIDFGLAHKFGNKIELESVVGTPYYVAPEVLLGSYDQKCDIWSAGVILYMLLCGKPPFVANSHKQVFNKILHHTPKFSNKYWQVVSDEAKHLVASMLSKNPKERPTAQDSLSHPWIVNRSSDFVIINPEILNTFVNHKAESLFRKAALGVIVKNLSIEEIKDLKEAFIAMDVTNSGDLTTEDIKRGLEQQGYTHSSNKISQIMQSAGMNDRGRINYSDFLRMTVMSKTQLIEQNMWEAFKVFDIDNSGVVTASNLKEVFRVMNKNYNDEAITQMINEADTKDDKVVSFEEFKAMLLGSDLHST